MFSAVELSLIFPVAPADADAEIETVARHRDDGGEIETVPSHRADRFSQVIPTTDRCRQTRESLS